MKFLVAYLKSLLLLGGIIGIICLFGIGIKLLTISPMWLGLTVIFLLLALILVPPFLGD